MMPASSGLMAPVLQSAQASAIGGPLVNPNGQVIGITVGGAGGGLQIIGYAIPINTALAIATRIAAGHPWRAVRARWRRLRRVHE